MPKSIVNVKMTGFDTIRARGSQVGIVGPGGVGREEMWVFEGVSSHLLAKVRKRCEMCEMCAKKA